MIYLMRHGLDDENYVGGWSDVSLIEDGIKEVEESARWIRDNLVIKSIISSDINRAVESANIVSSITGTPVTLDSNLREQNKGLLNGLDKSIAIEKYPKYMSSVDKYTIYPQGESLLQLYERIKIYLDKLMKIDDNSLIVTHRGVINMIYYILNNIELDMDKKRFNVEHASIHELDKDNKLIRRIK